MDFLTKLINRPKSLVFSSADQMDSAANGSEPQTQPSSASKKLLAADRTKDTIQHIEGINIRGVENQTKEEVEYFPTVTLSSVTEEGHIEDKNQLERKERSWIKSVSPLTILPDIINVQPIAVKDDTEKSQTLTPNSDGHYTTIESQGNSTLTVPSIACDAVSSDEDIFTECQSYVEQQMPIEDEFNRSAHWNTMLSNVTSSNIENLESIEHTTEQGVIESSLDLELSQELEADHEVNSEDVGCVQSSTGAISQIQEELKSAKIVSHSPDSTLNHNIPESVKSVELDKIVDLKTICKDMISLCYNNETPSSSIIYPSITLEKECSHSGVETENVEQSLESPELNCFDIPNSSPNVTSTIEEECKVSGQKEICSVPNSTNKISVADKASGNNQLDRSVQVPKVALEFKESIEQEAFSPKLNLETTFSTNQFSTTFETTENIGELNQTDELSEDIMHEPNTYVDQLNTSFESVLDLHPNVQLEQSLFNIKSDVPKLTNHTIAADASKIMDQTIVVDTFEIMDQTIVVDASKIMDQTIIGTENAAQLMYMDHIHCLPQTECTKSPGQPHNIFINELMNPMDVTFKPPPIIAAQKRRSTEPFDRDFQGHGLILNPSDFDFLLSKGSNFEPVDDRSSVLLRFDPLVGHPVPVNQSQVYNPNLPTATEEQEEEANSKKLSGVAVAAEVKGSSNIVHSETPLENVVLKNIVKEPESIPKNAPLVLQNFNASTELIQSDDKMSVDVIQGLDIENDSKSEENLRQKTGNTHEYKMDDMEKKIKNEVLKTEDIEKKLKDAEQREEALLKRITEKDKTIAKMSGVIEAYEKAIAELIAEKEQIIQNYEKQMSEIKSERDLNYKHLTSLESTFTDLHAKYERSKQLTAKLKSSEEDLKQEKKQNLENLRLQEQRYEKMKSHAMQQLEIANNKLESLQKNHSMEVTRLKALLKKEEISRLSVNEQLQQKTRENEELMKICDELINGQGASS